MAPDGWNRRAINELAGERKVRLGHATEPTVLSVSKDYGLIPQTEKFDRRVASENTSHYKIIERGEFAYDPMLLWSGSIALLTCVERGIVSPAYYVFKTDSSVDPHYLIRVLKQPKMLGPYTVISQGTNLRRRKAQFSDFGEIELNLPPLPEQRRIAAILDTLDETIRRTEQVIEKLKQVKQGLLHDLLTRGIDENGELRPHPEEAPQLYKDSLLGRMPRGWEVKSLMEIVRERGGLIQTGPFGSQLHAHEYVENGVPVIMPQDIVDDRIDLSSIARITSRKAAELSRHKLQMNDAVFSRRGDLSRCAAIGERESGWLCGTGCLLVRIAASALKSGWFTAVYRHDMGQRQVMAQAVGSTMMNLNGSILGRFLLPLPTPEEQTAVVARAQALGRRTDAEYDNLLKLRTLKHGLIDDLLTGRVRINVTNEEES